MSRIILFCGTFENSRGEKQLMVDWAMDEITEQPVVVPCEHPKELGAIWSPGIGEYVIPERKEK